VRALLAAATSGLQPPETRSALSRSSPCTKCSIACRGWHIIGCSST